MAFLEPSCSKCDRKVEGKISFRMSCLSCGSDLHACKNCRYYAPGKPNNCMVPGTDSIRDCETANFCEEFVFRVTSLKSFSPTQDPLIIAKKLFGEAANP